MRISRSGLLCALLALLWSAPLVGQEIEYASSTTALLARLEAAERRIAELEGQSLQVAPQADYEGETFTSESQVGEWVRASQGGWFAGAELLFLQPFTSGLPFGSPNDFQPASRLWVGGQLAGGFGGRFRWFNYHQNTPEPTADPTPFYYDTLQINNYDFEITDAFQLTQNWKALASAGLRYTDYRLGAADLFGPAFVLPDSVWHFSGVGPTIGLQLNRDVGRGFSLFVGGQQSFLFGQLTPPPAGFSFFATDQLLSVSELQMGWEWSRPVGSQNAQFFVRTILEAQYYYGGERFDVLTGNVGLIGGGLTLGIRR